MEGAAKGICQNSTPQLDTGNSELLRVAGSLAPLYLWITFCEGEAQPWAGHGRWAQEYMLPKWADGTTVFHVWERSRPANMSILTEHQITNLSILTRWQELPAGLRPSQHGETFHYWGHRCQTLPSTYSKMSKAPAAIFLLFLRINPHSLNTYGGQHKEAGSYWKKK